MTKDLTGSLDDRKAAMEAAAEEDDARAAARSSNKAAELRRRAGATDVHGELLPVRVKFRQSWQVLANSWPRRGYSQRSGMAVRHLIRGTDTTPHLTVLTARQ